MYSGKYERLELKFCRKLEHFKLKKFKSGEISELLLTILTRKMSFPIRQASFTKFTTQYNIKNEKAQCLREEEINKNVLKSFQENFLIMRKIVLI